VKLYVFVLTLGLLLSTGSSPVLADNSTPTPAPAPNRIKSTTDVGAGLFITPTLTPTPAPPNLRIANPVNPVRVVGTPVVPNNQKLNPGISVAQLNMLQRATGVAAVFEPNANQQLEVFAATSDGTLKDVWKAHDGPWARAFSVTGPGFATGNGQVAAVWQPLNEHLEVFAVDSSGTLKVVWKAHDGGWAQPANLTGPGFAPAGAPVAAVWQPLDEHLEVFVVDGSGSVQDVWKAHDGAWQPAVAVAGPGFAQPGAALSAVWQPLDEHLEVFGVSPNGTVNDVWKAHDGAWQAAFPISGANFALPGAPVSAVWQPLDEHLEVFGVDPNSGALNDVWKAHDAAWQPAFPVSGPGFAPAGAEPSAVWQPLNEHLEVFATNAQGGVEDVWKQHDGAWQSAFNVTGPGFAQTDSGAALGETMSAVWQPLDEHLEVFGVDGHNAVQDVWKQHDGQAYYNRLGELVTNGNANGWQDPGAITQSNLGPKVFVDPLAPQCTHFFSMWRGGYDDDDLLNRCNDFFGITAWCSSQGSDRYLAQVFPPQSNDRIEVCAQRGKPLGDALEQTQFLATAIGQALLSAAPFVDDVVQGTLCLYGTLFACATLAANGASQANLVSEGVAQDAVDLTGKVGDCADGDIVACAQAGVKGVKDAASAANVKIPGADAADAAIDCANNQDFDSCVQLGEMAADAAGLPPAVSQAAANVKACSNGDTGACIALGQAAAQAGVPTGGVAQGASLIQTCAQGDVVACTQLGKALVAATS
jgi:hypothetical protein